MLEALDSISGSVETGIVASICNLSTWRVETDKEFKVILGYTENSSYSGELCKTMSQNKTQNCSDRFSPLSWKSIKGVKETGKWAFSNVRCEFNYSVQNTSQSVCTLTCQSLWLLE